jgi:hypothetical protein
MRTLFAIALLAGGIVVLLASADPADAAKKTNATASAKKKSVKPRTQTTSNGQPRAAYAREEVECERARNEDPSGLYAGYPCWAREAMGSGKGSDRE